jgi:hypothetical protein
MSCCCSITETHNTDPNELKALKLGYWITEKYNKYKTNMHIGTLISTNLLMQGLLSSQIYEREDARTK